MQDRVAVVESTLYHGARHILVVCSDTTFECDGALGDESWQPGRLTDGVDVFLERDNVIQNDTQTLITIKRQHTYMCELNNE